MNLGQAVYFDEQSGTLRWREQQVYPLAAEIQRIPWGARIALSTSPHAQGARHHTRKDSNDE